jgi:sialate O-acetylesterase
MKHLILATISLVLAGSVAAAPKLPAIFGSHMVMQRAAAVPVWGWAAPGEILLVEIAGQSVQTTADAAGKWRVTLDLAKAPSKPLQLSVTGTNVVTLDDVLVGEVWLASGQSNMEFPLSQSIGGDQDTSTSANPSLRFFKVARTPSAQPLEDTEGRWMIAGPQSAGSFSAVGYYFGRDIQRSLGGPVGIIDTSIGGTQAESWMSPAAVEASQDLHAGRDRRDADVATYSQRLVDYRRNFEAWQQDYRREDRAVAPPSDFATPGLNTADWKKISLPAKFAEAGLPDSGAVWVRKTVPVTPGMARGPLRIDLGGISDFATVYWDGEKIGETNHLGYPGLESRFTYEVPANRVKAGEAVLAVRIVTAGGGGGLQAGASGSSFRVIRDGVNRFFLAGDWLAKVEYASPPLPATVRPMPREPNLPTPSKGLASSLYKGLINPIVPVALRGVIWYQGESNAERAWRYRTLFPALINDWRQQWGRPELSFYFVQIANFGPLVAEPGESGWAELREAQAATLALPHTGMAVTIDVGEEVDIHPRDKATVGYRLAQIALAKDYGKKTVWSAAEYQSMKIEGGTIRLNFSDDGGGLVAKRLPDKYQPRTTEDVWRPLPRHSPGGALEGFAICGADRRWVWADEARIEGDSVVVSSARVPQPVAARYAWADSPVGNLTTKSGLPVSPFRTDDFPAFTKGVNY